ncbi:MAG: tRNA preQ1(34) S-adenosylmethionine ribosyltransferase-isomerase QueA [bacterium]
MKLTDFDYYLPKDLIAQQPLSKRDESRLLVLHRKSSKIEDRTFRDIIEYLVPGDTLVLNDTKVFPARLFGVDGVKNKQVEILLHKNYQEQLWEVLIKPAKKVKVGTKLQFGDELKGEVIEKKGSRGYIKFEYEGDFFKTLDKVGKTPLPPYIKREAVESDIEQYQTIYARHLGAVAAPTAGFHFTHQLLKKISDKGVNLAFITLHVGIGTFSPIRKEHIIEHHMEEEYYEISSDTAEIINQTTGKIVVVGTTTVRALETASRNPKSKIQNPKSKIILSSGFTDLFIYPGFDFKVTDMLITNFHLPKTTLLILVSAFAGRENILSAYKHAINKGYRFYSYGDAMLII